jgi:Spy/CpxP family protein refolding chaperone
MRTAAWLAVVVLGFAQGATAQPRRGGGGSAAGAGERRGTAPAGALERREQIKKKIRAMRAYTLTEELSLDEPTAGKLFPMLSRYDDETDRLLEKRVDVQRRLRHADSLRDPRAVERLIDEAVANQRAFWDLEEKRVADLRKILTPVQAAKLLVVLPAIERKIQNQLRKAIVQRRTGGRVDDSDDDQEPDELAPELPPKPSPRRREVPLAPRGRPSNAPGNTPPCDPGAGPCR